MKTYKHLYPKVWAWGNLYLAYRRARKGKRGKVPVADFEFRQEDNLVQLQNDNIGFRVVVAHGLLWEPEMPHSVMAGRPRHRRAARPAPGRPSWGGRIQKSPVPCGRPKG